MAQKQYFMYFNNTHELKQSVKNNVNILYCKCNLFEDSTTYILFDKKKNSQTMFTIMWKSVL